MLPLQCVQQYFVLVRVEHGTAPVSEYGVRGLGSKVTERICHEGVSAIPRHHIPVRSVPTGDHDTPANLSGRKVQIPSGERLPPFRLPLPPGRRIPKPVDSM